MTNTDFTHAIWIGIVPAISIGLVRLFGRLKIFRRDDSFDLSIEPLSQEEFRTISQRYAVFVFAAALASGALVFNGLAVIYFKVAVHGELLRLPRLAYGIPAIFFGMALSSYPGELFLKKYLRERYLRYVKSVDVRYQISGKRLTIYFGNFVFGASALLFAYELHCTSFLEDGLILINKFGTLTTASYQTHNISKIEHSRHLVAPNGNVVYRPNFNIFFSDGFRWNIDDEGDGPHFVEVVGQKSGQSIVSVD